MGLVLGKTDVPLFEIGLLIGVSVVTIVGSGIALGLVVWVLL